MTMPDSFEIRYERNLRDVLAAAQLYQSGTTKHRIYQVVALILVVVATYQGLTLGFGGNQLLLIAIGILLAIDPVPLILTVMSSFGAPEQAYTVQFSDAGVHVHVGQRSTQFPWARFVSIVENRRYLLLVHGSWSYVTIPQRAFTAEQRQWLQQMINTHRKVQ